MSKIIKFPVTECQELSQQPEQQHINIDIPEVEEELVYSGSEEYINHNECYRCGHKFDFNSPIPEQIWYVDQVAGYHSKLDEQTVSIMICDKCFLDFIFLKRSQKNNKT